LACTALGHTGKGLLDANMRPEVVSKLLSEVTHRWVSGAVAAMRHEVTSASELAAMKKSCGKVVASVVGGSEGDKARSVEYFREVCSRSTPADHDMCQQFADGLISKLSDDSYANREELNVGAFCAEFYSGAVQKVASDQSKILDSEDAKKAEAAKKTAEEKAAQEKKTAELKVESEKLAAEQEQKAISQQESKQAAQKTQEAQALLDSARGAEGKAAALDKEQKIDDADKVAQHAREELQLATQKDAEAEADAAEQVAAEKKEQAVAAKKAAQEKKQVSQEKQAEEKKTDEKKPEEKVSSQKSETKVEEKHVETQTVAKKQGLLAKRAQLGQKSLLDINQKAYIEGQPVLGDGAGQGNLNKCMELADAFVKNPMAPDVKVCGTGIKLTVFLLGRCGEGSVNSANLAHTWDIGACDSGLAPSVCKEKSPAQDKRMGVSQSYKITQC